MSSTSSSSSNIGNSFYQVQPVGSLYNHLLPPQLQLHEQPQYNNSNSNTHSITVLSYNVNCGYCKNGKVQGNSKNILEAILNSRADIVCLQETHKGWEHAIRDTLAEDYPYMLFRHHSRPSLAQLKQWSQEQKQQESLYNSNAAGFYDSGDKIVMSNIAAPRSTTSTNQQQQHLHHDEILAGGLAILSRAPFSVEEVSYIAPSAQGSLFPAMLVKINSTRNSDFNTQECYLLNVHLRPPLDEDLKPSFSSYFFTGTTRLKEIQELYHSSLYYINQHLKKSQSTIRRLIIAGDFNEGHSGSAVKWLRDNSIVKSEQDKSQHSTLSSKFDIMEDTLQVFTKTQQDYTWKWPLIPIPQQQVQQQQQQQQEEEAEDGSVIVVSPAASPLTAAATSISSWFNLKGAYDHIFFTTQHFKPISCDIMHEFEKEASDHLPVLVTLQFV